MVDRYGRFSFLSFLFKDLFLSGLGLLLSCKCWGSAIDSPILPYYIVVIMFCFKFHNWYFSSSWFALINTIKYHLFAWCFKVKSWVINLIIFFKIVNNILQYVFINICQIKNNFFHQMVFYVLTSLLTTLMQWCFNLVKALKNCLIQCQEIENGNQVKADYFSKKKKRESWLLYPIISLSSTISCI